MRSSSPMDSHASLRHSGEEEMPILLNNGGAGSHSDIIVNVDGDVGHLSTQPTTTTTTTTITNNNNSSNNIWRETSYDFRKDGVLGTNGGSRSELSFANQNQDLHGAEISDDAPTTLLPGGKRSNLDAGFGANEPKDPPFSNLDSASSELRHSSHDPSNGDHRDGSEEFMRCTSNASFRRRSSTVLRAKTRSRLMDPAPPPPPADDGEKRDRPLNPSEQLRSGLLRRPADDDDEDPFFDEDAPLDENFKHCRFQRRTILEWASPVLILAALACSLFVAALRRKAFWGLRLWKWELLALVLVSGRLVSGWAIRVAVFFLERSFLLRKRVLYFVYGVRKAVQNCLWLGLVLLAWSLLFDQKVERETKTEVLTVVSKILFCLLVATLIWLAKTILVKALASSFHVSTYFERIQENLFSQYVIQTLSGPPLIEIQHARMGEDLFFTDVGKLRSAGAAVATELKAVIMRSKSLQIGKSAGYSKTTSKEVTGRKNEGITIDHLQKLNQKNVSAWNMKRLMKMAMNGRLMLLDEQIPNAGAEDESTTEIQSEFEAKAAAKKIFSNVAKPGSRYIYLVDLMRFMKGDEALKTMNLIEGDQGSDRVSKKSLKNWVIHAFRERRALSFTLNDTKTAVNKLHLMANIVVVVIVGCIWLLILGFAPTHFFVFISSQLLLVTFVFGNTLKNVFEAIIFLFVTHPFDVGDRCEVEGVQMVVEEMNILTTIFLRHDNQKIIYPNSVLATVPIGNIYRSPDMGDSIDFCIHGTTPVEKLAVMKERIKEFIERKKDHWYPNPTVMLKDIDDMNRLKVSIWLRHRMNYQEMGERWKRRELVFQEMIRMLRELDIEYRMLPLDVNLHCLPNVSSTQLPSTFTACR